MRPAGRGNAARPAADAANFRMILAQTPLRFAAQFAESHQSGTVTNTVVLVVANHQDGLADHWMKRIGNYGFECQKPGTMAPVRTKVRKIGHV
jgi:hypothetical protein